MSSVFEHLDYRDYIKERLRALPKKGHGEAKKIAKQLGVSSTFISQALAGDRQLTSEHAQILSEYFSLTQLESDYFHYLIQWDRAGTLSLRKYIEGKMEKVKKDSLQLVHRVAAQRVFSDEEKSIFYSSPIYSAVHLFTSTQGKGRTLEDIAQRFELSLTKAAQVLRFLREVNLVTEKAGHFQMGTQSTHLENSSPHLLKHLANWRIKAIQASDSLTDQEMMYTSQVSLSVEDFHLLRERMAQFIKSFLETVHASPAEEVACFNLDWFWIRKS